MFKKVLGALIPLLIICCLLTGCSAPLAPSRGNNTVTGGSAGNPTYHADWPYYYDVSSLVECADCVFEGKITNIDFAVIDIYTGAIVTEPSEDGGLYLYTIYEIDVQDVYMGDYSETKYIAVMGGIPGYKEDEQLSLMKECGLNIGIPVLEDSEPLTIGSEYLFLAVDIATDYLRIPNPQQFAFDKGLEGGEAVDDTPSYDNIKKYFAK